MVVIMIMGMMMIDGDDKMIDDGDDDYSDDG